MITCLKQIAHTEENTGYLTYKERIVLAYFSKLNDDGKDAVIDFTKKIYKEENNEEICSDRTDHNVNDNTCSC